MKHVSISNYINPHSQQRIYRKFFNNRYTCEIQENIVNLLIQHLVYYNEDF